MVVCCCYLLLLFVVSVVVVVIAVSVVFDVVVVVTFILFDFSLRCLISGVFILRFTAYLIQCVFCFSCVFSAINHINSIFVSAFNILRNFLSKSFLCS